MSDDRDYIETYTGQRFRPLAPDPFTIRIADIAHSLSNTCRYRGHCCRYYSVAEHSVLVSRYVPPELAMEGLLHDAAEAYLGDVPRPLKQQPAFAAYREAEERVEVAIASRYGLRRDSAALSKVKAIDTRILGDEIEALMRWEHHDDTREAVDALGGPLGVKISGWEPKVAAIKFLARFSELGRRS